MQWDEIACLVSQFPVLITILLEMEKKESSQVRRLSKLWLKTRLSEGGWKVSPKIDRAPLALDTLPMPQGYLEIPIMLQREAQENNLSLIQVLLHKVWWEKDQRCKKTNMEEVAHSINKEDKTVILLSVAVLPEDSLILRFKSSLRS